MKQTKTKSGFFLFEFDENAGLNPNIKCIMRFVSHPVNTQKVIHWKLPHWVLDYNWDPTCDMRVGHVRSPWQFREGRTAHLYPPNTDFWADLSDSTPGSSGVSISFWGGKEVGLEKLIVPGQSYAQFYDMEGQLGHILDSLSEHVKKFGDKCYPAVQSVMWDVFHMLLMSKHMENENYLIRDTHLPEEETFSLKVENYMREHYGEKLTLAKVSHAFGVSPKTLTRRFRDERNTSPMARLNEIRIGIVKTMLMRGSRIFEIAGQTGFSDEFHLSKTFKKITGQSPRDFVKTIKSSHNS